MKEVKEEENLSVLSITHDIDEAAAATRVLVMKDGQMIQEGSPETDFFLMASNSWRWDWISLFPRTFKIFFKKSRA